MPSDEIQSLNQGSLNADELSVEELEQVSGGTAAGCTDFTGSCEGFSGSCTRFGPKDDQATSM